MAQPQLVQPIRVAGHDPPAVQAGVPLALRRRAHYLSLGSKHFENLTGAFNLSRRLQQVLLERPVFRRLVPPGLDLCRSEATRRMAN